MRGKLWPSKDAKGGTKVAARYRVTDGDTLNLLRAEVDGWNSSTVGSELRAGLMRPPYVAESEDWTDIVFEGLPGNRLWRDCLVSFTRRLEQAHPEVQRIGFWDLIGDEPNVASLRT